MAIDALELVFVRPEIGTFILLTGDSDFSSLVLKLKEYGKYVIGVGIQESTSDILVQNCDEYYSYTGLTGLKKTTEADQRTQDPWILVRDALKRMADRDDVMRSDRLKQVMQEIDPAFDEGSLGFSKFSKFLAEASSRGLVRLHKLDNGQYEVSAGRGRGRREEAEERDTSRSARGRGERREREAREPREDRPSRRGAGRVEAAPDPSAEGQDPLRAAYGLLRTALDELRAAGRYPVRDSDVKRKLLELDESFDEAELGFPKFSKFLAQAADHDVVMLAQTDGGNLEVALADDGPATAGAEPRTDGARPVPEPEAEPDGRRDERARPEPRDAGPDRPVETVLEIKPSDEESPLGPRLGSTRRRRHEEAPTFFEGQVVETVPGDGDGAEPGSPGEGGESSFDAAALGLPTDPEAIVRYLAHRYRGVGEKTAESLVERFGVDLFRVLRDDPSSINAAITPKRAEQVLEAWDADYERRRGRLEGTRRAPAGENGQADQRGRRGGRRRGSRSRGES